MDKDNQVYSIVRSLGFRIARLPGNKLVVLYDSTDILVLVYSYIQDVVKICCYRDCEELLEALFTTECFIIGCINDHCRCAENPYLRCKSLEEALIRKDLIDVNDDKTSNSLAAS